VSPILVRPVREQLEHDRIIRLLPGRYRRRFEVVLNPAGEQNASVGTAERALYPDAVLYGADRGRKVLGVVEVETGESVNHLECMAQWAHYGRLKVPFHLYVPVFTLDVARRLFLDHHVPVAELWTYDSIGDQVRFTLVHKAPEPPARASAPPKPAARPRAKAAAKTAKPRAAASRQGRTTPTAASRKAAASRPAKPSAKRAPAARTRKAPARKVTSQKRR
jgi:hypothetical protein